MQRHRSQPGRCPLEELHLPRHAGGVRGDGELAHDDLGGDLLDPGERRLYRFGGGGGGRVVDRRRRPFGRGDGPEAGAALDVLGELVELLDVDAGDVDAPAAALYRVVVFGAYEVHHGDLGGAEVRQPRRLAVVVEPPQGDLPARGAPVARVDLDG